MPLLIVLMVTSVYQFLIAPIRISDAKERIRNNPNLSAEQIEKGLASIEQLKEGPEFYKRLGIGLGAFGIAEIIKLFVVAGVFMLAVRIKWGKTGFKKILSVTSHVNLVSIISVGISLPLILIKKSLNVYTSLAALLPPEYQNSLLHRLLNSFDVFAFWKIVLFSIGLGVVTEFPLKKSTLLVVYVWIGWIIVYSLLGNMVRIQ